MTHILDEIIQYKKTLLKPASRRFYHALKGAQLSIISEIKRASPSKGALAQIEHPEILSQSYTDAGADAISVLTDEHYFHGSNQDLIRVRERIDTPILRKDFIIDESQIVESVQLGADAILLIMAALNDHKAKALFDFAKKCHLDVLVETHNHDEIERAIALGADLIGINNRDLRTFKTDIQVSLDLIKHIPSHIVAVSESGIHTVEHAHKLKKAGFNALLIGEALVQSQNVSNTLSEFKNA